MTAGLVVYSHIPSNQYLRDERDIWYLILEEIFTKVERKSEQRKQELSQTDGSMASISCWSHTRHSGDCQ